MDVSEDEMFARHLAMELNRERFESDHEVALRMQKEFEAAETKKGNEDQTDYLTHLFLQEQMQDLVRGFAFSSRVRHCCMPENGCVCVYNIHIHTYISIRI